MVRNISLQLYCLASLGPKLSDLALASEACWWSQTQVCALLSSPNWWQPCPVDLMRWGQIKARICNVRCVFPGEKTKIADMPLSHSLGAQPRAWKHIKGHTHLLFTLWVWLSPSLIACLRSSRVEQWSYCALGRRSLTSKARCQGWVSLCPMTVR